MRRRALLRSGLAVPAAGLLLSASGWTRWARAELGPEAIGGALAARLESLLGTSRYRDTLPAGSSFLALVIPGMSVTAEELSFEPGGAGALKAEADFARKVNLIPAISAGGNRWQTDNRLVWNEYKAVLTQAKVADHAPTPAERRRYTEARQFLDGAQSGYDRYRQLHDDLLLKFRERKLDAEFGGDKAVLARWQAQESVRYHRVVAAHRDWVVKGNKSQVEEAHAIIAQLTSRAPLLAWRVWADQFETYKRTAFDQTFWLSHLNPAEVHDGQVGMNWTQFELQAAEIEAAQGQEEAAGKPPILALSVELARARVVRPWMDPALFHSRFWKLDYGEALSDGGRPPRGRLVAYITAVIFARNLCAHLVDAADARALLASAREADGNAPSLGCFSLEGAKVDHQAIKAPNLQIIAYLCQLLPLSPDPDPELHWIEEKSSDAGEDVSDVPKE